MILEDLMKRLIVFLALAAMPAFSQTASVSTRKPQATDRAKVAQYRKAHPMIASQVGDGQLVITQVAAGDGWTTAVTIVNVSSIDSATYVLDFYGDDGSNKTFFFAGIGSASELTGTLPPNGSTVIQVTGVVPGESIQGWAKFDYNTTTKWISGHAIFRYGNGNEAAVPFENDLAKDLFLPFDLTGGYGMGVAMASNDLVTMHVTALVFDEDGNEFKTISGIVLTPYAHTAFDLASEWGLTGFRGTILFRTADQNISPAIGLAVLGIRYNPQGFFTSVSALDATTLDGSNQ